MEQKVDTKDIKYDKEGKIEYLKIGYIIRLSKKYDQNMLEILFSTYLNFIDTPTLLSHLLKHPEQLLLFIKNHKPHNLLDYKKSWKM